MLAASRPARRGGAKPTRRIGRAAARAAAPRRDDPPRRAGGRGAASRARPSTSTRVARRRAHAPAPGDRGPHARASSPEPMPTVIGDEALLGGLFTNLLTNALKYGPASAREHPRSPPSAKGRLARLHRVDDGPPIPDARARADLRALPARPPRAALPRHRLGLAICRRDRRAPRRPHRARAAGRPGTASTSRCRLRRIAAAQLLRDRGSASSRDRASSLRRMCLTWERTVSGESTSASAIWSVVRRSQIKLMTSHSRGVSGPLIGPQRRAARACARMCSTSLMPNWRETTASPAQAPRRARARHVDLDVLGQEAARAGAQAEHAELVLVAAGRAGR